MRWWRWLWSLATWNYYARLRRIDVEVLWPVCVREAPDLDFAKAAFAVHAFNDKAWLCLGDVEILRRIDLLEALPTGGREL